MCNRSKDSGFFHRLLQISNDIFRIFETDAEAEEAFAIDCGVMPELITAPVVVDDQALHIAE